jgi:hypothetical protein
VVGYDLAGLDRPRTSKWISCLGARRHPRERIACQVSLPERQVKILDAALDRLR